MRLSRASSHPTAQIFHFKLRFATPPSTSPHSRFGVMADKIKRIHDIHFIQFAIDRIKFRGKCHWKALKISRGNRQVTMLQSYQTELDFLKAHPAIFRVDKQGFVQFHQTKGNRRLDAADLSDLLHAHLPPMGCLPLSLATYYAHQCHPNKLLAVLEESPTLQKHYSIVKTEDDVYLYKKADVSIANGAFFCQNRAVATALEAACYLLPSIPTYWVPVHVCYKRVTSHQIFVQNYGYRKMEGVLRGSIQSSFYKHMLFTRRSSDNETQKDLPQCTQQYDGFDINPMRILKIAMCLPAGPAPLDVCASRMFPSITMWFKSFAQYTIHEIAAFYPNAIHIDEQNRIQSRIRASYPGFAPDFTIEPNAITEKAFEAKVNDPANAETREALFALVSEPSTTCFVKNDSFEHDMAAAKSTETYSVSELYQCIIASLRPQEKCSWREIRDRLMELPSVNKQKVSNTLNSRTIRKTYKFLRFVEDNQPCPLAITEERLPGQSIYNNFFSLKDPKSLEVGNPFLEPNTLIEEIRFQIETKTAEVARGLHEGRFVTTAWVRDTLPVRARIAVRSFGGLERFIEMHGDIFAWNDRGALRVRSKEDVAEDE